MNTASQENAVAQSAQLGETVKGIIRLSHQVYLGSLNAMFIARSAGSEAGGFVCVTTQLRRFSQELNTLMGQVRLVIEEMIARAVEYQRDRYIGTLALEALARCEAGTQDLAMAAFRQRVGKRQHQHQQTLAQSRRQLAVELERVLRLTQRGASLAVLGKIEAANPDPAIEQRLRSVADSTAVLVGNIEQSLHQALALLNNERKIAA